MKPTLRWAIGLFVGHSLIVIPFLIAAYMSVGEMFQGFIPMILGVLDLPLKPLYNHIQELPGILGYDGIVVGYVSLIVGGVLWGMLGWLLGRTRMKAWRHRQEKRRSREIKGVGERIVSG